MDIVDKKTRSRMMAGIRARNTAPELALRRQMHSRGFRFRLHVPNLPGSPDLVFPKYKAAVLVHGCFWHRHLECRFAKMPATNAAFWATKLAGNVARDAKNLARLREAGWRTAVVWECELRDNPTRASGRLAKWLQSKLTHIELPAPRATNRLTI